MTVHHSGTEVFSSVMLPSQTWPVSTSSTSFLSQARWVYRSHRQKTTPNNATAATQMLQPLLKKSLMGSLYFVIHGMLVRKAEWQHCRFLIVFDTSGGKSPPDDSEKSHHGKKRHDAVKYANHELFPPAHNSFGRCRTSGHTQPLKICHDGVFFGFTDQVLRRIFDLLVGVRHPKSAQGAHTGLNVRALDRGLLQPRIGGHVRFRYQHAWITQVQEMPFVGITLAYTCQIRTRTLGA